MEVIKGTKIHDGIFIGTVFMFDEYEHELYEMSKTQPLIMVANNFSPLETMLFRHHNVCALVSTLATSTSHTAILSATMDWPAVSKITIKKEWHGQMAIIDGNSGLFIVNPDLETEKAYFIKYEMEKMEKDKILNEYINQRAVTKSGKSIKIYSNISVPYDAIKSKMNGAEGIGNFKTEFMYLESNDYPTEDELFKIYSEVVSNSPKYKVVIRTFDIGNDKVAPYFMLDKEENPALGYRAIRIGLDRPELQKTQMRAILRASALGNVSIMYPMVVSVDEILKLKQMLNQVMDELKQEDIPFNQNIEQGIMIETPAAVIISDELAKNVDFFSIGTNDLIQYTLATDRQNYKLSKIYNPYHTAITRSIAYVVRNAHKAGIWVEISGELGSDLTKISEFINMGIDALAVSPAKIPRLRKAICEME